MEYYNNSIKVKELLNKVDDNTKVKTTKMLYNRFNAKDVIRHSDNMLDYVTVGEVRLLETKINKK